MTERRGRCTNLEFCSNATSNRILTVDGDAPFVCPKCGERLEALPSAPAGKPKKSRGIMIAAQAAVIVLGGGVAAYKLLGGTAPDQPPSGTPVPVAATPVPATVQPPSPHTPVAPQAASQDATRPAATTLFRMAGSDVLGSRLARRLASGYLGLIGDADLRTETDGQTTAIVGNAAGEHEQVTITAGTSATGLVALLRGSADIALSVRAPAAAEIAKFAGIADLTSPANERVIAVQPLLAIVSPANSLPALSPAQLQGVLSGRIADWAQLGAAAGPIHVIVERDPGNAGDSPADAILAGAALAPHAQSAASEADLVRATAADPLALGVVSGGHQGAARVVPILTASGAALAPTEINVATEEYPLTRRLYLYTATVAEGSAARRFLDYATSAAGQAAVEAAGFTALTVRQVAASVPATASDRFRRLVAGATRVSIDFRFQPGSTSLDSRSARDVERLVGFLRAQHAEPGRLILAGFADGQGQPAANLAVSQRRVDAVVAALTQAGAAPGRVANFGAELPLADNATAEGRERNRRVEVYLAP